MFMFDNSHLSGVKSQKVKRKSFSVLSDTLVISEWTHFAEKYFHIHNKYR